MYNKIYNPETNRLVSINSKKGKNIFKKYINQLGGKYVGKGTYKCVVNPPIKCLDEDFRYGDNIPDDSSKNYISAIMKNENIEDELRELRNIYRFDPERKFTIGIVKKCDIGILDPDEESEKELINCLGGPLKGYTWPFTDAKSKRDLKQLIFPNGGISLDILKETKDIDTKFDLKKLLVQFLNIIEGIKAINDSGFIHSDIKPANIVYNKELNKFFLIDFGMSGSIDELMKSYTYSQNYLFWGGDLKLSCNQDLLKSNKYVKIFLDNINKYLSDNTPCATKAEYSKLCEDIENEDRLNKEAKEALKIKIDKSGMTKALGNELSNLEEHVSKLIEPKYNISTLIHHYLSLDTKKVKHIIKTLSLPIQELDYNLVNKFYFQSFNKLDIFSIGMTLHRFFFESLIIYKLRKQIKEDKKNKKILRDIFFKLGNIILKCLDPNPINRINHDNLVKEYKKIVIKVSLLESR